MIAVMVDDESVTVGGEDWLPEYPRFFFEAARRLLEASGSALDAVALPLVYLQRHCVELVIKEIHLASHFVSATARSALAGRLLAPEWPPALHGLVDLIALLETSLNEHGIAVPAELKSLASDLDALERKAPDRFRYAFRPWTKQHQKDGRGPDQSFPEAQHLPIAAIQRRLASVIRLADFNETDSLVMTLYQMSTSNLGNAVDLILDATIVDEQAK